MDFHFILGRVITAGTAFLVLLFTVHRRLGAPFPSCDFTPLLGGILNWRALWLSFPLRGGGSKVVRGGGGGGGCGGDSGGGGSGPGNSGSGGG